MDFADLENEVDGRDNMGGVQTVFYYGVHKDVSVFPDLPDLDTAAIDEAGVVVGATLAMKTGKKMFELYGTQDMIEVTFDEQGPVDGKSVMGKLTFSTPGMKEKILGFWRASNNAGLFFIAPDNNGDFYLIGNAKFPAKRAGGKATTGKATGDGKTSELTFQAPSVCPLKILLTEADLDRLLTVAV